jgi:hypothetical protein
MRSLEMLILVACLGLVAAIWEWHHIVQEQAFHAAAAVKLPVTSATGGKTKAAHKGGVVKNAAGHSAISQADLPAELFAPGLNSRTTVVSPLLGVPDSEKMEIGTTRSELRKRYGKPAVAVESVDNGCLVERYYYLKPDHENLVIAVLSDGKLVSAQTAQLWQPQKNYRDQ